VILADSTIWCAYLPKSRTPNRRFSQFITERKVLCHPWVYGELLLAGISEAVAAEMKNLDFLDVAPDDEAVEFIERYHPQGVGWVDVNLLVACLKADVMLWTDDRGLRTNAVLHRRALQF
jgi:hypothetical protein